MRVGGPGLFEDELLAIYPSLRNFARMRAGSWHEADDLVQATIERCLDRKPQFKLGTNLRAWAITIMRNMHLDGLRKISEQQLADDLNEPAGPGSAEAVVELNEVHQFIMTLPLTQREVLVLKAEEYTDREIAEVLSIPEGTARRRLHDGRKGLVERFVALEGKDSEGS